MNFDTEKDDIQGNKFVNFLKYDFKNDKRFQTGWQKLVKCNSKEEVDQTYFKAKLFYYSKYFQPISSQEFVEWKKKEPNIEMPSVEDLCLEGCSKIDVLSNGKTSVEENIPVNIEHSNTTKSEITCEQSDIVSDNHCAKNITEPHNKGDFQNYLNLVPLPKINDSDTNTCYIQNAENAVSGPQNDGTQNSEISVSHSESINSLNTNSDDVKNSQNIVQCPQTFSEVMELIHSGEPIPGIVRVDVEPTNTSETPSSKNRIKKPWE